MTNARLSIALVLAALLAPVAVAQGQDVRPLAPILEPVEPPIREPGIEGEGGANTPTLVPLPEAASRAEAAARDRVVTAAVLPASWTSVVGAYQPIWVGIASPNGFGLDRWGTYFTAAALSPVLVAHPFLSPWGLMSYDGWVLDRYRAVWSAREAPGPLAQAARELQRGDRAMLEGRADAAVEAYGRVTQAAPELPLGHLALGAALAAAGDDERAARAFRQSLDRYPPWLALNVDWELLFGGRDRLVAVQAGTLRRAQAEGPASRFVAGVLHLFGDRPGLGRRVLGTLPEDPHATILLARGPR